VPSTEADWDGSTGIATATGSTPPPCTGAWGGAPPLVPAKPGPAGLYVGPVETTAGVGRDVGDAWGTGDLIGVTAAARPGTAAGTADGAVGTMNVLPHDLQRAVWPAAA
jgi:hypothetical protein